MFVVFFCIFFSFVDMIDKMQPAPMIKKISTSSMPRTFVNACLVRNCSIIIEKTSTMQSQTIALTTANVVRV